MYMCSCCYLDLYQPCVAFFHSFLCSYLTERQLDLWNVWWTTGHTDATPLFHRAQSIFKHVFLISCVGWVRISPLVTWNVFHFFIHLSLLMRLSHSDKVWHQCNITGLCGPPRRSCDPFSRAKWSGGCQQHSEWCNDPNHPRPQRSTNQYHPMCEPTCELFPLETVYRFNTPFFKQQCPFIHYLWGFHF